MSTAAVDLFGATLLSPGMLLLALLLPAAWLWRRRRGVAAVPFGPAALVADDAGGLAGEAAAPWPRTWRTVLLPLPGILVGLGLLALVVALARPVAFVAEPARSEGIDIVLALDTSSSMGTRDLDGARTRLDVARDAAIRFVEGRPYDRIGLVAFARFPDLRCPPTLDHAALAALLREVGTVVTDGPEDATGLGTAVARAVLALQASGARSKVVVLLTDGEENVATAATPGEIAPAHAGQLCERFGIRVWGIVVGGGGPAAAPSARRPDTRPLERLAQRTGGGVYAARDASALASVYARIDALERSAVATPRVVAQERHLGTLAVGLALLLLGRMLGRTVLGVTP